MKKTICIYHSNCADGFGAAWVVRKALDDSVNFYPGVYQKSPPDVSGRHVILVDFSYKKSVIDEMRKTAKSITIIDHHKSAIENLADDENINVTDFPDQVQIEGDSELNDLSSVLCNVYTFFDLNRSGAILAWDFFFQGKEPPKLLRHIQDRDLWQFKLEGTREIQANVFSYPYDFNVWDKLMDSPVDELYQDGVAIERKHFKDINELLEVTTRKMDIGGYVVPVANMSYMLSSDAGHILAQGNAFAGCYWDTPDGRVFSLRSSEDGVDVSEIAVIYGGGGHQHAAGFKVSFEKAKIFELEPLMANK